LVEVALQRIEGWRKCRTPPLGDPWRPLGVSRRFEDSGTQDQGGYGFPPGPRLVDTARDGRPTDLEGCSRSRTQALLALTCPFRDRIPAAPHRGAASPIRRPGGRLVPVMLPLLGFRALRHTLGPADPHMAADPSTAACHVRGLATSFAASTTGPTGARSAGASMGFALQGVPLGASGAPLGALALLTLPATPPPEGSGIGRPPTGPRSRDESVLPPSSQRNPAVDAFLGFSPPERSLHPPGRSLVVTMPALSPLGGMTSLPTWTSGLLGSDGSAWSVSGLPALLGFCTLRPSRRSVHRPGERAHGFTSRRTPRACATPTAI
jgi:hypothetical protein